MNTEQERAEFEAFASKHGLCVTEDGDLYRSHVVAWMRKAWQARAALQSQEREDALRYRFIRSIVSASNARGRGSWQFHYDRLPMPLNNPMKGSVTQHFDEAIDYARRAEGEQ